MTKPDVIENMWNNMYNNKFDIHKHFGGKKIINIFHLDEDKNNHQKGGTSNIFKLIILLMTLTTGIFSSTTDENLNFNADQFENKYKNE